MDQRDRNRIGSNQACSLAAGIMLVLLLLGAFIAAPRRAWAQQAPANSLQQLPESPKPQNNAPQTPPDDQSATAPTPPQDRSNPGPNSPLPKTADVPPPDSADNMGDSPQGSAPKPNIRTMPAGSVPRSDPGSREQLWVLQHEVSFVTVPVTVKDRDGHLVEGLLPNNFSVYEDGVKQNLKFFTSDPFPLSAAVVIDLGMGDNVVSKVRDSLPALVGAFGQYDEVAIFSYYDTVKKWQDLTPADKVSSATLRQLKSQKGSTSGAPVIGGPLGQPGPVINGRNMDNTPNMSSMPTTGSIRPSRVLNDAILAAAQNLARKDRMRRSQSEQGADYRKILFVISDGQEWGSTASYADVMRFLLTNNISVYAVGVGGAAMPIYGRLGKVNVPKTGTGNILPKYASATGGQVFSEFGSEAIEAAYSSVTSEARNQYTLGYTTRATPSGSYRTIEVRISHPGLRVYARDGYYPLPPPKVGSASSQQP